MQMLTVVATTLFLLSPRTAPVAVENLNLDYAGGSGKATAAKAQFVLEDNAWSFTNAQFDVREEAGRLVIERQQDNFSYGIEAPFLEGVKKANARAFWLDYAPGRVITRFQSAVLEKDESKTNIGSTALTCRAAQRTTDPIDACIFSGTFTMASLKAQGEEKATEVSDVDVAIIKGKTNFTVKVSGIGTLKGNGTTTHEPANSLIKIKVDKVKLGILDVTGQFFSQLADAQSENLKVERPYIYVTYKSPAE